MRVYVLTLVFVVMLSSVIAVDTVQVNSNSVNKIPTNSQSVIPEFGVVIAFIALIAAIAMFEINKKGR